MEQVTIYTDGACRGNPGGPGGWGYVIQREGEQKTQCGGDANTTNNRMELTAALAALEALERPCRVTLVTDSQYVCKGMREWLAGWIRRGWVTGAGEPVKNIDLWQELHEAAGRHEVWWRWVRGHNGDPLNEAADRLANEGLESILGPREPSEHTPQTTTVAVYQRLEQASRKNTGVRLSAEEVQALMSEPAVIAALLPGYNGGGNG